MFEGIKAGLIFIFGKNAKTRYRRIVLLLAMIGMMFFLAYNLHIPGYWEPAGKVNIELKK